MEHDIMFKAERLHCEFGRYKDFLSDRTPPG